MKIVYIDRDDGLFYYLLTDPKWSCKAILSEDTIKRIETAEKEFEECQEIMRKAYEGANENLG